MTESELKEIESGRICLIPNPGVDMPSCHEFTPICDCTVLALVAEIRALRWLCESAKMSMRIIEEDSCDFAHDDIAGEWLRCAKLREKAVE